MHAGMRNAWPRGRAAVCTSQPVSEMRVCLWCTIAAISGRCRRFSYFLQSSGSSDESRADHSPERISATIYHTSTPRSPSSAADVAIRHALGAVHTRATGMAAGEAAAATHSCAHRTGHLHLSCRGPLAIGILRTYAWRVGGGLFLCVRRGATAQGAMSSFSRRAGSRCDVLVFHT